MRQHKWNREIKAWADGAEIEYRKIGTDRWYSETEDFPYWDSMLFEYRIRPTDQGPRYLYVYKETGHSDLTIVETEIEDWHKDYTSYLGKIRLEVDDE